MILNEKFNPSLYSILIIEDSPSVTNLLTRYFTNKKFNCESVKSLQEAKEVLNTKNIHYIMLDIDLSGGCGYKLIDDLKDTPEKIFVMADEDDKQFREIAYQKGVIDIIAKDDNFYYKVMQLSNTIKQLEDNKSKTVLVVDDSPVIQRQLEDLLSNRHYNIKLAEDAATATQIIHEDKIDLILLDIQLKNSNGIEFLQKNGHFIRNIKKIPVLVISSFNDPSTARDALKEGAFDVIKKPYIVEEIVLKVDLWIDYKRKEEEVLCSNQLLQEYKDTVDESTIVSKASINGIITYVNEKFCTLSGYSKEELIGQNHNIVRHPDMPKEVFTQMWHTIKELKKTWKGKVKNRKKDGGYYWVDATIRPIIDIDGNIVEFIGIRYDITKQENVKEYFRYRFEGTQKNLDDTIKLAKEYEKAINESNILSRSDTQGNITFVNDKFCEITGYTKNEVMGKNHNIVRHPDTPKEVFKELWKTIAQGDIFKGILKNRKKDGTPYWVDTTIVPILNDKNRISEYIGIRHDLTELFELHKEIESTQKEIIYKMGEIGESRSKETGNHVKRVAEYSKLLALLYGLSKKEAEVLFTASPMHDIGKVAIPDSVLKKPGKLDKNEWEIMQSHATIGYKILKGSKREVLNAASIVSHEHHEKWDGSGYPRGLQGKNIHIYGRITAVADVFDALGSDRCYKKSWELEKILKLFEEEKGKHFEPKLVDLFFENLEQFLEIRDKYNDTN